MSDYIVSARKYRPQNWHTVVGQKSLVQTLKNAIVGGKLAHAYLFCGPRGVGKTTCARIFAKTINCEHLGPDGEACNECESCQSFNEQRSYNVYELDGASNNSVDNIRDLIEQVAIPPQIGKYKVFIIDEVHMLSTAAFNAFLKTLEEPPKHAIFVMATTEKHKILPTILSRCQTYDFQRISTLDIVEQLQYIAQTEGISAEPQALQVIARKADGGMRDALSLFDQITSFTGGQITYQSTIQNLNILDYEVFFRLTDAAIQGNIPAALLMLDDAIRRGFDPQFFIGGFASHLRDLMVSQDPNTLSLIEAGPEVAQHYQKQASQCKPAFLYHGLAIAADCDFNYRNSRNKRLSVELALVKICQLLHPVAPAVQPQTAVPQSQASVAQPAAQPMPARPVAQAPVQQHVARPATPQPTPAMPQAAPQPQPQSRPAAPQPAPQRAPQAAPPMGMPRMVSMRTSPAAPTGVITQEAAQPTMLEMNEPVADDALRRMWRQYTTIVPSEKLLVNLMLNCAPKLVQGTQYEVTLVSDSQREILMPHLNDVTTFLQRQLQNSHIAISIVMSEVENNSVRAFSPREKFVEMQKSNGEALQTLVDEFGLEFS